jgi:hypothetical protein
MIDRPSMGGHAVKKSRFAEKQIAFALKQAGVGAPVEETRGDPPFDSMSGKSSG